MAAWCELQFGYFDHLSLSLFPSPGHFHRPQIGLFHMHVVLPSLTPHSTLPNSTILRPSSPIHLLPPSFGAVRFRRGTVHFFFSRVLIGRFFASRARTESVVERAECPSPPLTNEVRKTSNEYHGVADNLWTLNVKNLRGFVAKDCEIQSWIDAEYLFGLSSLLFHK